MDVRFLPFVTRKKLSLKDYWLTSMLTFDIIFFVFVLFFLRKCVLMIVSRQC